MTTDNDTIEKQLEKNIFNSLVEENLVKERVQRLEVVVLRLGDEDTEVGIYGQLKKGLTMIDTVTTKLELKETWKEKDIAEMAKSLADSYLQNLKESTECFKL